MEVSSIATLEVVEVVVVWGPKVTALLFAAGGAVVVTVLFILPSIIDDDGPMVFSGG
jgi:hypothetical protein